MEQNKLVFKLLQKIGEFRCNIQNQPKLINMLNCTIDTIQFPDESFKLFIIENLSEITDTLKIIRWVKTDEYCNYHNISRQALNLKLKKNKVRSLNGLYDIDS